MALTKKEVLQQIKTIGIMPVLRAESAEQAMQLADAIIAGGVTVLEVTMTVPDAVRVMAKLVKERPNILVGAGTVLDAETARACIEVGAQFVVSPALDVKTVELCQHLGIAVLPGALTPTEVVKAWQCGADVVKIFPANSMGGAKYIRSLKAPLPQVEMIPTGGVSLETAKDFLEAGVFALGVGADLVDATAIAKGTPETITENARQYLKIVSDFRGR